MDTFDQHEPLGKAFAGSLATHAALAGVFILAGVLHFTDSWGTQKSSSGTVGVTMVSTIPIQRHEGPKNPVANDTNNLAPQETMPVKVKQEVKAPDPKAIQIPDRLKKPEKVKPKPAPPPLDYKPMAYQNNQVYTKSPQAMSSPMYGIKGAGGIDVGPASILGNKFGAYTDLMVSQIQQHWNTADVRAAPTQRCAISFAIARNGSVTNVQVSHPSGSFLLDTSAKRAILDAAPLPTLPPAFPGSEATVELWFQ